MDIDLGLGGKRLRRHHAQRRALSCRAAVICTGTYLRGRTITGESAADSGPDGLAPSIALAGRLAELGLPLRRFKTGTPPARERAQRGFLAHELQEGDAEPEGFSYSTATRP